MSSARDDFYAKDEATICLSDVAYLNRSVLRHQIVIVKTERLARAKLLEQQSLPQLAMFVRLAGVDGQLLGVLDA